MPGPRDVLTHRPGAGRAAAALAGMRGEQTDSGAGVESSGFTMRDLRIQESGGVSPTAQTERGAWCLAPGKRSAPRALGGAQAGLRALSLSRPASPR